MSFIKLWSEGRSPRWPALRDAHLHLEPVCQACGTNKHLEVHHIVPVHVDPTRELDPGNLLTLCETPGRNCHLTWGHGFNWKSWMPAVRENVVLFRKMLQGRKAA